MVKGETAMELCKKLNPNRFTAMSGKMAAILGFVLRQEWTQPTIAELHITIDGYLLARRAGDVGCNDWIGGLSEFDSNIARLFDVAGLTQQEVSSFWASWKLNVKDWRY